MKRLADRRGRTKTKAARPRPRQVLVGIRQASWGTRAFSSFVILFATLCALFWFAAAATVWDALRAANDGLAGSVVPSECTAFDGRRPFWFWTHRWSCDGTFTADDGTQIEYVGFEVFADVPPEGSLAGHIRHGESTTVWIDGGIRWLEPMLYVVLGPVLVWWSGRFAVEYLEPVTGWPSTPESKVTPKSGTPPPTGRDRRRRKRRRR